MEAGEAFKQEIRIRPAQEGTFLVRVGSDAVAKDYGFTCLEDLLIWMAKQGARQAQAPSLVRPGVMRTSAVIDRMVAAARAVESGPLVGLSGVTPRRPTWPR